MDFSNENIINAVQNHPVLWDTTVNASEEDKEFANTTKISMNSVHDEIGNEYS